MSALFSVRQAAKFLDYHPQTVRQLARKGVLPAIKRRQKWFFKPEELSAFLISNTGYPLGGTSIQDL